MFRNRLMLVLILLIVPVLAACGSEEEPSAEVGDLPTRFVAPTRVASATPTVTNTPRPTFTATDTPSTTPSATSTPTSTRTPTITNTPAPPTNTPTPSITPTATNTPTATATATPPATATPNFPQITSFTASQTSVPGNTGITLFWEASGDTARIEVLSPQGGSLGASLSVPVTGQVTVTVPNSPPQVIYRLIVDRAGQSTQRDLPITVQQVCPTPWFFGSAPTDLGCPIGPQTIIPGKLQVFQQGLMINLVLNGQNQVYGFNTQNNRYMVYTNAWDGVTTYSAPCGTVPPGLFPSQDVFNWAFNNTNGTVGLWCDPTTGIGYPVAGANLNASLTVQFAANGTTFVIGIPGYGTLRVEGTPATGSWTRLQ